MFPTLFLLFTCVPIVELILLIELGQATSVATTIGIVITTGVIGAALARREGFKTWQAIQHKTSTGQLPSDELVDGLMILIAGVMLVTPGLLTDGLGFALLISPIRRLLRRRLSTHFGQRMVIMTRSPRGTPYEVVDEQDATEPNPPPR